VSSFRSVVVCDFEYEAADGDLPNVLCMVGYVLDENLQHVRTIRLWRGEFGSTPPFDIGDDTLFVAYSAWAEMTCFMVLGWKFPQHIFDQHTAYLAASNVLLSYDPEEKRSRESKRLPDACRAYGVDGWELIDKDTIAKDIGEGNWRKYGKERVLQYCEEDVRASTMLLRAQLHAHGRKPAADVERVLYWSEYSAKAVARIQARGIPIDMDMWNLVQENKAAVILELLREFDPSHNDEEPIYTLDGQFSYKRFEAWLARIGAVAWPRLKSGKLDTDSDAFRLMYHVSGVESLHALKDGLRVVATAKLPIGKDGRNRPKLFPFCTATGRNAHSKSLYNAHAGMRSFIRFPKDHIGVYLDWRTQEVGIAAYLSGDQALMEDYRRGDIYHALALMCGRTDIEDPELWKKRCPEMRTRMKPLQLGINYGMSVPSLAKGLGSHPLVASGVIELHKRTYPQFWHWRRQTALQAMLDRKIESVFGWPLRLTTSPNERALFNFPMQSAGADMLRLSTVWLCEAGIVPSMLIHDGILFEVDNEEQIALAKEVMRKAGLAVCPGLEIGVDKDQDLRNGARYRDKRPVAKKMWGTIMRALQRIGALPTGEIP
jgi:DNA polymerase I